MADSFAEAMDNLTALDKQLLVERHLISREHAAKNIGSGLVVNRAETFSVMINEEDHLRMQALRPGFQTREAWQAIDKLDSALEKKLNFAFDNELGYLTACPTNLGTGIRVSAMLHLPGLVLSEQINPIIQSVNKLGPGRARAVRRRHRGAGQRVPGFQPDDAGRERNRDCRTAGKSAGPDHRA